MLVISYVSLMITFAIFALTKDQEIIKTISGIFAWKLIAPQINAVLSSVIYLKGTVKCDVKTIEI